jgi:hypothetical protein
MTISSMSHCVWVTRQVPMRPRPPDASRCPMRRLHAPQSYALKGGGPHAFKWG